MLRYADLTRDLRMSKSEKAEFNGKIYRRYSHLKNHKYFKDSKGGLLHRHVWEFYNGEIPKGFHIHHKDMDITNNSIENLDCLSPKNHCKAHSILAKMDPAKDIYETRRNWHKSICGALHHKEIWKNRHRIKTNCHQCNNEIERYKCGIGRYICTVCRRANQLKLALNRQKKITFLEKKNNNGEMSNLR